MQIAQAKVNAEVMKYFLMMENDLDEWDRGFIDWPSFEAFKNGLAKHLMPMPLRRLYLVLRQETNQSPS